MYENTRLPVIEIAKKEKFCPVSIQPSTTAGRVCHLPIPVDECSNHYQDELRNRDNNHNNFVSVPNVDVIVLVLFEKEPSMRLRNNYDSLIFPSLGRN
jgi:hypothetical protein